MPWVVGKPPCCRGRARARARAVDETGFIVPPPPGGGGLYGEKSQSANFANIDREGGGEEEEEEEEEEAAAEKGKRVLRAGKIIAKTASGQVRQHRQQRGAVSRATIPRRAAYPHL